MPPCMRSKGGCTILGLLLFGFCVGCGSDDGTAGGGGAAAEFAAFDSAMTQFVAERGLRGASAVLVQKDRGIVHTAGYGEFSADRTYLIMRVRDSIVAGEGGGIRRDGRDRASCGAVAQTLGAVSSDAPRQPGGGTGAPHA